MHVVVSARHQPVSQELKGYAAQKAEKLTRFYDRIQEIEVILEAPNGSGGPPRSGAEMIVNAEHNNTFVAHVSDAESLHAAVDACVEKLKHQLSDHHKRVKNRKHPEDAEHLRR